MEWTPPHSDVYASMQVVVQFADPARLFGKTLHVAITSSISGAYITGRDPYTPVRVPGTCS